MATQAAIVIRRITERTGLLTGDGSGMQLEKGQWGFATEDQTLVIRDLEGYFYFIKTESAILDFVLVKEPKETAADLPSTDQTGTLRMVLEADSYYFKTASTWVRIPDIGYFEQMLNNLLERIDAKQDQLAAGDHQITLGDGSATPPTSNFRFGTGTAEGATPEASFEMYDSAAFKATNNARLELYGGAKQVLADSAQLSMSQSSQLHMSSDASLLMHNNANVLLTDNVNLAMHQNAKTFLTDNAQLLMHNSSILKTLHNTKTEIRGNLNDEYSSLPALPSADFYHIWICSSSNGPRTQGLITAFNCAWDVYTLGIWRPSEESNWAMTNAGSWKKVLKEGDSLAMYNHHIKCGYSGMGGSTTFYATFRSSQANPYTFATFVTALRNAGFVDDNPGLMATGGWHGSGFTFIKSIFSDSATSIAGYGVGTGSSGMYVQTHSWTTTTANLAFHDRVTAG